jgi:hypothetical protein
MGEEEKELFLYKPQAMVCNLYANTTLQFLSTLQFAIFVPTPHYSSRSGYTLGLTFNTLFMSTKSSKVLICIK